MSHLKDAYDLVKTCSGSVMAMRTLLNHPDLHREVDVRVYGDIIKLFSDALEKTLAGLYEMEETQARISVENRDLRDHYGYLEGQLAKLERP